MGGGHDGHGPPHPVLVHGGHRLPDGGVPVLRPHVDPGGAVGGAGREGAQEALGVGGGLQVEEGLEADRLGQGDLVQGAFADGLVPLGELLEELLRGAAPPADVRVVRLHLLGGVRGAVGHEQDVHAATSWMSSTT